mmetsp:Transcript_9597/g.15046  ORF Transcript_9597/g.15046 Transcript_9597/m.15046 type:complete len:707 (+) Transcript_9597:150-2270(+)
MASSEKAVAERVPQIVLVFGSQRAKGPPVGGHAPPGEVPLPPEARAGTSTTVPEPGGEDSGSKPAGGVVQEMAPQPATKIRSQPPAGQPGDAGHSDEVEAATQVKPSEVVILPGTKQLQLYRGAEKEEEKLRVEEQLMTVLAQILYRSFTGWPAILQDYLQRWVNALTVEQASEKLKAAGSEQGLDTDPGSYGFRDWETLFVAAERAGVIQFVRSNAGNVRILPSAELAEKGVWAPVAYDVNVRFRVNLPQDIATVHFQLATVEVFGSNRIVREQKPKRPERGKNVQYFKLPIRALRPMLYQLQLRIGVTRQGEAQKIWGNYTTIVDRLKVWRDGRVQRLDSIEDGILVSEVIHCRSSLAAISVEGAYRSVKRYELEKNAKKKKGLGPRQGLRSGSERQGEWHEFFFTKEEEVQNQKKRKAPTTTAYIIYCGDHWYVGPRPDAPHEHRGHFWEKVTRARVVESHRSALAESAMLRAQAPSNLPLQQVTGWEEFVEPWKMWVPSTVQMEQGLNSQSSTLADSRPPELVPAEVQPATSVPFAEQDHALLVGLSDGFIVSCSRDNAMEFVANSVISLPPEALQTLQGSMQTFKTAIFLFDADDRVAIGVFCAVSAPGLSLHPRASFSAASPDSGNRRTRNAQKSKAQEEGHMALVRIRRLAICPLLHEDEIGHLLRLKEQPPNDSCHSLDARACRRLLIRMLPQVFASK